MRLGVVGNPDYPGLPDVMRTLLDLAPQLGLSLVCEDALERHLPEVERLDAAAPVDAMLSLGGDGTLLRAARLLDSHPVPILGVNLGRLGFLTSCDAAGLEDGVRRLAAGDFVAERRMALRAASVDGSAHEEMRWRSLNDVVLHKGGFARVVRFAVWVDGEPLGAFAGDGLVVSTPTGSTAYSLSAGGPVVVPTVESIILTPVSPHTLAIRPLVLPPTAEIHIRADSGPEALLVTIDGQVGTNFDEARTLVVRRAETPVLVVRFAGSGFFQRLRQKMGWGGLSERDEVGRDPLARTGATGGPPLSPIGSVAGRAGAPSPAISDARSASASEEAPLDGSAPTPSVAMRSEGAPIGVSPQTAIAR